MRADRGRVLSLNVFVQVIKQCGKSLELAEEEKEAMMGFSPQIPPAQPFFLYFPGAVHYSCFGSTSQVFFWNSVMSSKTPAFGHTAH